jgi:hypothetical protein
VVDEGPQDPEVPEITLPGDPISNLDTAPETQDLEPGRDRVRAFLAVGLLGLLSAIVLLGFLLIFKPPQDLASNDADLQARTVFVQTMLSTVAGVFGAATGFYFGSSKPNRN